MKPDLKQLYSIAFWISLSGILMIISDFGFSLSKRSHAILNFYYYIVLFVGIFATILRYIETRGLIKKKVLFFDSLSIFFSVIIFVLHLFYNKSHGYYYDIWLKFAVLLTFVREFSELKLIYKRTVLNPAQLFVASFLVIILLGAFLLKLPNATHGGISFIDALFTSTSAVCVTGLIVVDTGTYFTEFGQVIIVFLIQIGGLGILTFASYFSYFFKGGSTYENQLALSDMTSSKKLGEVFSTLKYIILITFTIELFSGILIYSSLNSASFQSQYEQVFFAVFHSVSAFCNAGFSTLSNGLYEDGFKFNYYLQLIIILTFVLGGLGFPIVSNIMQFFRYKLTNLLRFRGKKMGYKPWVLTLNSRITLITTISLTVGGFILFYVIEYNNTLSEHGGFGKIVTALFGAATPRTAGFNTIDTGAMSLPAIMLVMLLMWIGASPLSTGGGIKTSTFAIATLNILSLAKGKTRIEIFRREISDISVRRAFATISLSLIIIGFGVMLISIFDRDKDLMSVAFECFSAYSTVGLSLGITADLSSVSKFIVIVIMFVGRVSMLSIIIAVFRKVKHKNYRYPTEEIMIN